ncbi:hypothetical protein ACJMK2_026541 [Sinanodonta woodiana]|uniref:Ig-like domain-containing protein n=1 Tax=Sinanodonta woodiana TaxID=1069815 RepID=A0ABD3XLS1_SINWO
MDLFKIFSVTILFVLLSISGVWSATITLSKSADKGQLGNNSLSLFCDYSLSAGQSVLTIDLKRKRADDSDFISVVSYYEDKLDATYFLKGSDLMGRTVITNPTSANRRATLKFSSIKCTDEADYRCELLYASRQGNGVVNSNTNIVLWDPEATPIFGKQKLLYNPTNNLAENQNVTFTCIGNVGHEPQGTFSWYKYVRGQASGVPITNGIKPVSLTIIPGSCTYVRTENLILTLTKEDNLIMIRCTVWQTTMTETGDANIQTDRITVYCKYRLGKC